MSRRAIVARGQRLGESHNKKHVKADWQFTTADGRVKLKRLYPAL
jgi:hypothetical protein